MIKLKIKELLKEKNLIPFSLQKAGLSNQMAYRLANNEGMRIELNTIDRLCKILDVEPGDLFEFTPDEA